MPNKFLSLLIALFLNVCCFSQAKDTVFLMNGHAIASKVTDSTSSSVTIQNPKKVKKKIHYEWDQLYMVKYANGRKRYYYVQDSTINNWFTRDEMWMYMKGENDARKGFRATGSIIGGALAGIAGGLTGTIWGPIAPFGFMALTGIPKVRIWHRTVSNIKYLESDAYILGYERVARQKRKLGAVIAGAFGLLAGYTFYAVYHDSYPNDLNVGFK
jgi:hypothetical protein